MQELAYGAIALKNALETRKNHHPGYSLRAFARDVGLSPQALSNVLNGVRGLSPETCLKVARKLGWSKEVALDASDSFRARFSKTPEQRKIFQKKLSERKSGKPLRQTDLSLSHFRIIAEPHHQMLIEVIRRNPNLSPVRASLVHVLKISENELDQSLTRLLKLGIIGKNQKGYFVHFDQTRAEFAAPNDATRTHHERVIDASKTALFYQGENDRYGSSSIFSIRKEKLGQAKELIREFRKNFKECLVENEAGEMESPDSVYALSIQFFKCFQFEDLGLKDSKVSKEHIK